MTADPTPSGQMGLFGPDPEPGPAPASDASQPAAQSKATRPNPGGSPARAVRVMQDVRDGRLGVLDVSDRVVEFYGDGLQVRFFPDEDVAAALIAQRYVTGMGDRHRLNCRHGAILRPVTPLRLTPEGKRLLLRWASLVPLPGGK